VIDLHTHILPGIDDGPLTLRDALDMARAAADEGVTVLAATPHVREDYPTTADTMQSRLAEVRDAIAAEGLPLDVLPGGELDLDRVDRLDSDELTRFGLGGNPNVLLLEFPYRGWPGRLLAIVLELRERGVTAVIAHPERSAEVQANPELLSPLVAAGAMIQVTAASLDGRLGRRSRATGLALVRDGLAHLIASDAHTAAVRAIGMRAAAGAVGDPGVARWLTEEMPAALLTGEQPPARQRGRSRRRLRSLLRAG
jgi:protein-tyrosine phosphatase